MPEMANLTVNLPGTCALSARPTKESRAAAGAGLRCRARSWAGASAIGIANAAARLNQRAAGARRSMSVFLPRDDVSKAISGDWSLQAKRRHVSPRTMLCSGGGQDHALA